MRWRVPSSAMSDSRSLRSSGCGGSRSASSGWASGAASGAGSSGWPARPVRPPDRGDHRADPVDDERPAEKDREPRQHQQRVSEQQPRHRPLRRDGQADGYIHRTVGDGPPLLRPPRHGDGGAGRQRFAAHRGDDLAYAVHDPREAQQGRQGSEDELRVHQEEDAGDRGDRRRKEVGRPRLGRLRPPVQHDLHRLHGAGGDHEQPQDERRG